MLLERRDANSHDMIGIVSQKIFRKLGTIREFRDAQSVACYYPTGSEILTHDIMLDALSRGRQVCLPRIAQKEMHFRQITGMEGMERGAYDIMEPREDAPPCENPDVTIVPSVGLSRDGSRLGYGRGYYDRFLAKTDTVSFAVSYSRQMVKSIPVTSDDVGMDWIVTEDEIIRVTKRS